ncbi:type IV secretion system protein VirB3 [Rhizobium leguminosarum]|uniref:type IV secretion system protein VirB3 n=1 Tax=Rhizobium TaxID=379 RepID=UPI0010302286|nr:type IV secretion system protein VirB3 [Rhizobium leguminosarum]TBF87505.1 type IV secretion system protein VirB3 [Rhizobium leguminosarum]TBG06981.1 type IV secretion system protein VirB3 [Rhizobium leguminosarum]TBG07852.1 type IV secretion system protein VirB3 [Rhizobium leguminosarum]TBG30018.1 type IV secretion system protein VirB3 [Rhizobium leguminosarum]TBG50151.1 type IV secretion system protein VirB3 [Rhizobium leguminosarum]
MSGQLEENPLYIAATRPALFYGVPLPLAGGFLVLAGFIIILLNNPLYELIMAPLWFGARIVVEKDYNAGNVLLLWLKTAARAVDTAKWGGSSVSPNPIKVNSRGRGLV